MSAKEVDSEIKGIRIENIVEKSGAVMYGSYGKIRVLLESGDDFYLTQVMSDLSCVFASSSLEVFNEDGVDWIRPEYIKYVQVNSVGELLFRKEDFNRWLSRRKEHINKIESKASKAAKAKSKVGLGSMINDGSKVFVCLGEFALINTQLLSGRKGFSVNKNASIEWVFFNNKTAEFKFLTEFSGYKVTAPTKESVEVAEEILNLADDREKFATIWTVKAAKRSWGDSSRGLIRSEKLQDIVKFSIRKNSVKEFTDEVRSSIYDFIESFYPESSIYISQLSESEYGLSFTDMYGAKVGENKTLDKNLKYHGMANKFRAMIEA